MSDRAIIAIALAPVAAYLIAMAAVFAAAPLHFPAAELAGGGTVVVLLSVGFANFLRLRRDGKPHA